MMQLAICETYKSRNTVQKSPPTRLKNKQLFLDMFVVSESKHLMCFNVQLHSSYLLTTKTSKQQSSYNTRPNHIKLLNLMTCLPCTNLTMDMTCSL